jgi:hypothetical protein
VRRIFHCAWRVSNGPQCQPPRGHPRPAPLNNQGSVALVAAHLSPALVQWAAQAPPLPDGQRIWPARTTLSNWRHSRRPATRPVPSALENGNGEPAPGSPSSSPASTTTACRGLMGCCHGTGKLPDLWSSLDTSMEPCAPIQRFGGSRDASASRLRSAVVTVNDICDALPRPIVRHFVDDVPRLRAGCGFLPHDCTTIGTAPCRCQTCFPPCSA